MSQGGGQKILPRSTAQLLSVPLIARHDDDHLPSSDGVQQGVFEEQILAIDNTMGNSSSSNKISAQDKYDMSDIPHAVSRAERN